MTPVHRRSGRPQIARRGSPGGSARPQGRRQTGTAPVAPAGAADPRSTVNATEITVVGNVVNSPTPQSHAERQRHELPRRVHRAPVRQRHRRSWVDGATFFVDVECWGELGGNVVAQHQQGRPGRRRGRHPHARVGVRAGPAQPAADQGRGGGAQPGSGRGRLPPDAADARPPRHRSEPAAPTSTCRPPAELDGPASPAGTTTAGRRTLDELNPADLSAEPAHV